MMASGIRKHQWAGYPSSPHYICIAADTEQEPGQELLVSSRQTNILVVLQTYLARDVDADKRSHAVGQEVSDCYGFSTWHVRTPMAA